VTRAERRIEAAKRRVRAAEKRLSRAYEVKREAIDKVTKRLSPPIWVASRQVEEARQRQTEAELAAVGIVPMKTIVTWKGARYVVSIKREGWPLLVPVGKRGLPLQNRVPKSAPYLLRGITVTQDVLAQAAGGAAA
jgi:hypothetical protein